MDQAAVGRHERSHLSTANGPRDTGVSRGPSFEGGSSRSRGAEESSGDGCPYARIGPCLSRPGVNSTPQPAGVIRLRGESGSRLSESFLV